MKDKIDMAADIPQSILANKDLIPSQQTWSWYNIFAFWMSDVHSAGGYIFAGTLFSLGLAGWQVFISLIAGILIILVLANIIGVPSQKFAIPFPVISRMTYGVFGSNIPALIRGIIAIVWYGIQTYLASAALMVVVLYEFPSLISYHESSYFGLSPLGWGCFLVMWLLQTALFFMPYGGHSPFHGLGWADRIFGDAWSHGSHCRPSGLGEHQLYAVRNRDECFTNGLDDVAWSSACCFLFCRSDTQFW